MSLYLNEAIIHSATLMNFVGQLSALEKEKSSSILLFERRKEENEGFACSERNEVPKQDVVPE